MNFRSVKVALKGQTPLLMNRCDAERLMKTQTTKKKVYDPVEDAEKSAYFAEIDGVKQLYVPALCVYTMMLQTCGRKKIDKFNAKGVLAGTMRITPEKIPLGTDKYEIDIRPAVVMKARIARARAMVPDWRLSFTIVYDADTITNPDIFREILEESGFRMGLLDYRPQHMGPFGTFLVEGFEPQ